MISMIPVPRRLGRRLLIIAVCIALWSGFRYGRKPTQPEPPFLVLPLYIHPSDEPGWRPLYDAATSNPDVYFKVIVNPENGPGPGPDLPEQAYIQPLQRLSRLPNVELWGYIYYSFGKRSISELQRDVSLYQRWNDAGMDPKSLKNMDIFISGIFVDELPNDSAFVQDMTRLTRYVKNVLRPNTTSFTGGKRLATVVLNPGVAVHPTYFAAADYLVSFEDRCQRWAIASGFEAEGLERQSSDDANDDETGPPILELSPKHRTRSIAIAHHCSDIRTMLSFSRQALAELGFAGVSATCSDGYEAWCPHWAEYVSELSSLVKGHARPY